MRSGELFEVGQSARPLPHLCSDFEPKPIPQQRTKVAIYLRVSTDDQNTDLQMSELLAQAKLRDMIR
ncbi:MAG: hypothetical protein EBS53_10090 [Bacteroidetes bacterium]|nr:hypothetical protein [Bacteroidota bacterium]